MISINFTLFVQIAHFLLLVWLTNRLLIRPVLRHLAEKDAELAARRSKVDDLLTEAADRQRAYREQIREAHVQANAEREKMLAEAQAEANALREQSLDEGKSVIEKVRSEIQASLDEVRQALRADEDVLAERLAQAYLGRKS